MRNANRSQSTVTLSPGGDAGGLGTAVYLQSGSGTVFGWLNRPAAGTSNLGLVICKPFGYEATCCHRSIRRFAEAAADAGIPTLRFDYLGTGDSSDLEPDDNQIEIWIDNVLAAVEDLRRSTGVSQICLLGIRLGALLASLAAARCHSAISLILISPVHDGSRYLRELRAAKLAADMWDGVQATPDAGSGFGLEVSGFTLSTSSVATLEGIRSVASSWPERVSGLIIDSASHRASQAWASQLQTGDGLIKYLALPGLAEMILRPAQHAQVPQAVVMAIREWLMPLSAQAGSPGTAFLARNEDASALQLCLDNTEPGRRIIERPVFIPADAMLFGVVSEPTESERNRSAILLLNSGADNHIGANRMHVDLARRWAGQGHVVLRFDLSGIGDSATQAGCEEDQVLPSAALDEIRAAVRFLRARYDVERISVGGVCSGAYHAFQAAVVGAPIDQIFLVNPLNDFWESGTKPDEPQPEEVVRKTYLYASRALNFEPWQQLIRGAIRLLKFAQANLSQVAVVVMSTLREAVPPLRISAPSDLATQLEDIMRRDIDVIFVFAKGEAGVQLLALQASLAQHPLGERCRVHVIPGGDHTFTRRRWRDVMAEVLSVSLGAGPPQAPEAHSRLTGTNAL